jgi:hypothetical protein
LTAVSYFSSASTTHSSLINNSDATRNIDKRRTDDLERVDNTPADRVDVLALAPVVAVRELVLAAVLREKE